MFIAQEVYKMSCFRLASILLAKEIPFKLEEILDGYGVILFDKKGNQLMDAVMHSHSYGAHIGLFEIMGDLTFDEQKGGRRTWIFRH